MTNYHPDPQRAYESHCADGYVVPDDEKGPQEATGATESDETRSQVRRDIEWAIRTGKANKLAPGVYVTENTIMIEGPLPRGATGDAPRDGEAAERRAEGLSVIGQAARAISNNSRTLYFGDRTHLLMSGWEAQQHAETLAAAGLLATNDARGALDETLDDLTRTLARAEKAEAEVARLRRGNARLVSKAVTDWEAERTRVHVVESERDRARDTAAALEAEVARLSREREFRERAEARARRAEEKVERVESLADEWNGLPASISRICAHELRAALSDTTGEAKDHAPSVADVCGSCGEPARYAVRFSGRRIPACLPHLNHWQTPGPNYTCPTVCVEKNHPGREHSAWLAGDTTGEAS